MHHGAFTPEQLEVIRVKYLAGFTYPNIAKAVGITNRNRISGQISRLREMGVNLPMRVRNSPKDNKPKPIGIPSEKSLPKKEVKVMEADLFLGEENIVTVEVGQCKFPTPLNQQPSATMFLCGKPVWQEGSSWCKHHYDVVHVAPRGPTRSPFKNFMVRK